MSSIAACRLWVAQNQFRPLAVQEELTLGKRKVLAFVDRHPNTQVQFGQIIVGTREIDPFFNANTPQDMEMAKGLIGTRSTA